MLPYSKTKIQYYIFLKIKDNNNTKHSLIIHFQFKSPISDKPKPWRTLIKLPLGKVCPGKIKMLPYFVGDIFQERFNPTL